MKRKRSNRRGYAMMLVLAFLVLFLAMLGAAWRQAGSIVRIETLRSVQARRDGGAMLAAVKGIHYLEDTPSPSSPQVFIVDGFSNTFTVTFTQDPDDPTLWTVKAAPTP